MKNLILNDNQKIAINHFKNPMMVLAGPGSGKTTVITHRIKNLIYNYNVNPCEIVVITFTKAAATEMSKKFEELCENLKGVSFGTFHSFFFKIIRGYYRYTVDNILGEDVKREVIKNIILKYSSDSDDDIVNNVLNELTIIKNELINIEYYNSTTLGSEEFIKIYKSYEKYKNKQNKIDFDDMLIKCYELLSSNNDALSYWQNKCKFILIDEFQDINRAQYECIKLLAKPYQNIFVVGDDDQSVYKFRGAKPEFLFMFPKDFENTETVTLDINYRSTNEIISFSNIVISHNKNRYTKDIKGVKDSGKKPVVIKSADIGSEAVNIATKIKQLYTDDLNEVAVIYRTNMQGRAFVDTFMDMKIPFQIKDGVPSIYEHWINKDICAYLKLSLNKKLNNELERIINRPTRYISKAILSAAKKADSCILNGFYEKGLLQNWQLDRIEELIFYLNGIKKRSTYEAIKYIRFGVGYEKYVNNYAEYKKMNPTGLIEILDELQEASKSYPELTNYLDHVYNSEKTSKLTNNKTGVTLSTMHGVKGLEYDTVFIAGCIEGVIPYEKSKTECYIEEERRLMYVAMTRARKNLYFSITENRYEDKATPTRFLTIK